jgi:hypothetical protein
MLNATQEEIERVTNYMRSQAPDLTVTFLQKVYSENVLHVRHDVWDVHTDKDRWWVVTSPMNLYSQEQFPNLDLALTFHVGLCLRIPRSESQKLSELSVEPFAETTRCLSEAFDALRQAEEVADNQAIGVRCREALLAFVGAAVHVCPWTSDEPEPKKADFKAWAEHICTEVLRGPTNENRRHLCRTLLNEAWRFSNWLTHAKGTHWHDAEAGCAVTESAVMLCVSAVILKLRGVPESCPACGSHRLTPERGYHTSDPELQWERPVCTKCGWTGDPFPILGEAEEYSDDEGERKPPEGECVIPTVPLRELKRP